MKTYNYVKVKELIGSSENLKEASLGMHEDWFWTASVVWEKGQYIKILPDNADELEDKFLQAKEKGLKRLLPQKNKSGFPKINPEYEKMSEHHIGGIYASSWATPTLQLIFFDGSEKMIDVSKGSSSNKKPFWLELGCLSQDVQDNITEITEEFQIIKGKALMVEKPSIN